MILTDTILNLSIEKYNRLFLYLIMKSKKKYEKIYNKIKNINIKTIYKINSITQVEEEVVKEVVEDIVKQVVEEKVVENIVKQDETDIVKQVEEKEVVKEVVETVKQVETYIVKQDETDIVKQDETDMIKQIVEDIVDDIVKQVETVKQDKIDIVKQVEEDKFCMPCIIKNDKKCLCCKPKKLDLPSNRVVFPSYDELYLLMNITQQTLFTKQIYICAKLLYDNITNNDLIDRVCKKIYDISGINGLEFVNTIIKSISIN
jgi:hypothetical protein